MDYQEGDAVRVKAGTACPDAPDLDISGWQGRITDLTHADDESEPVIGFAWDSLSLQAMPAWFIEDSERKGLGWSKMYLRPNEIEPAEPRDTEEDVARVRNKIEADFGWFCIGPEGGRIQAVVNSAEDNTDEWQVMLAWEKHLRRNLQFPFEAEVDEFQERGPTAVRGSVDGAGNRRRGRPLRRPRLVPERPATFLLSAGRSGCRGQEFAQRPTDPGLPSVVRQSLTRRGKMRGEV